MGVLLSFISFLSIIILTVRELIWPHSAYGWTSLVCVFCMMGGIVLLCLGILGQYLAKTYTEVKSALFTSPGNVPSSLSTNLAYGHRAGFQHYYAQL